MPVSALASASPRGSIGFRVNWLAQVRSAHTRATLSRLWLPTSGLSGKSAETGHDRLLRAGYIRQSQAGIFQLLPLGLRVQQKLEKLIDKHMQTLDASRVALSAISTQALWQKSGRLEHVKKELFRFTDQKDADLLLSPTHEEEITKLVAENINSYKNLPLRLYQITPKYRDEKRPRAGLLRSREFLMKDLYTFDRDMEAAIKTYGDVQKAYRAFFADLKLPIIVAEASSGAMGGEHSHEYHLAHPMGEDTVMTCDNCGYAANDEVVTTGEPNTVASNGVERQSDYRVWHGITHDRRALISAWYPASGRNLNYNALKKILPTLDTSIVDTTKLRASLLSKHREDEKAEDLKIIHVVDYRFSSEFDATHALRSTATPGSDDLGLEQEVIKYEGMDLLEVLEGDACPRCQDGKLRIDRALELGHTFFLGERYSAPLSAAVTYPDTPMKKSPIQMGCYGIGISRIMGTIAEHMSDRDGLVWPPKIAPYQIVIVSAVTQSQQDTKAVYDLLTSANNGSDTDIDVILDDREARFGWKMRDATMTGYPVVIIVGSRWAEDKTAEVECRRLGIYKQLVPEKDLIAFVRNILQQL